MFKLHLMIAVYGLLQGLIDYLDTHKEYYREFLKKKKRQDLENGGIISLVKVSC